MNKPQLISFDTEAPNPLLASHPEAPSDDLNIRALFQVLMARSGTIASTVGVVMLIATLVMLQLTPLFSATTLLMIGDRPNRALDVDAILAGLPNDAATIENQVQILRSSAIAERVIRKLHLEHDPELAGNNGSSVLAYLDPRKWLPKFSTQQVATIGPNDLDPAIVKTFLANISVAAEGRSSVIRVSYSSPDPNKAAEIANALADQYLVDQLETKFDAAKRATSWLNDRLAQLAEQVRVSESAVEQYKTEHGLTDAKDGTTLTAQQLTELNGQIVIARSNLAEQDAKYKEVTSLYQSGGQGVASVAAVLNSPVISALRGQEAELMRKESELSAKYGQRHPQMIALEDEKKNLEGKIQEEIKRVIESLAQEVNVARARLTSLESSVQQLQNNVGEQGQAAIRLHQLEREAESNRTLYQTFLARFKEAEDKDRIQTPDARIIATASPPQAPSFPNKTLILAAAFGGSTLLGILLALLLERLDTGYRTGAELERQIQLSNLAVVPMLHGAKRVAERVVKKPLSAFSESIRSIYTGVQLSNVDALPKVIMFTSSVPEEGKTSIALSVGRLVANGGSRVIIVDCDLRHPSVAKEAGARHRSGQGLVEVLSGQCDLGRAIYRDPLSKLEILCTYSPPSNPADLISSQALKAVVATLKSNYDLVLLDAAPVIPVSDSRLLSRLADKVVYVVRWDHTPREAVALGLKMLREAGANLAGSVLNQADLRRHAIYGYGYAAYGYGKYYNN